MARPTKYESKYNRLAKIATEKGFTDKDLADLFDVTEQTINNWKIDFPLFFESIKKGKRLADERVEQALYYRAIGYTHPDIHISNFQGQITITNIIKHYPPDPQAIFYWLGNRKPDQWKSVNRQIEIEPSEKLNDRLKEVAEAISKSDTNSKKTVS